MPLKLRIRCIVVYGKILRVPLNNLSSVYHCKPILCVLSGCTKLISLKEMLFNTVSLQFSLNFIETKQACLKSCYSEDSRN